MLANFHPDAQAELNLAIDYYEANQPSLGYQSGQNRPPVNDEQSAALRGPPEGPGQGGGWRHAGSGQANCWSVAMPGPTPPEPSTTGTGTAPRPSAGGGRAWSHRGLEAGAAGGVRRLCLQGNP
jgi:hypothetical protein